jgi:hypothetical protein
MPPPMDVNPVPLVQPMVAAIGLVCGVTNESRKCLLELTSLR